MHFDKKYSQTDLPDPDPHFIICTNHNTDRSVLQQFQNPGKMGWVYRKMVHFTVPESGYYECTYTTLIIALLSALIATLIGTCMPLLGSRQ